MAIMEMTGEGYQRPPDNGETDMTPKNNNVSLEPHAGREKLDIF